MAVAKAIFVPLAGMGLMAAGVGLGVGGKVLYDRWSNHSHSSHDVGSHDVDSTPPVHLAGAAQVASVDAQQASPIHMDWYH